MKVFVTGASGFIGTAVIEELVKAGHEVLGMVRSDESATKIEKLGAKAHRATLEDLESLKAGTKQCDAVIHCAFIHDFADFAKNCAIDKKAIETIGAAMVGAKGPFIVTSGTGVPAPGKVRNEDDAANPVMPTWPRASEEAAASVRSTHGIKTIVMRLPQVHDQEKFGLVTYLIELARAKGVAACIGDGQNRWPAGALPDAAKLYKLALEKGVDGANYNAVGEEGVTAKELAESIGRGLNLPVKSITAEEAPAHFGWMAMFASLDMPCSSALTQKRLDWHPSGPTMIHDLDRAKVFKSVSV